MTVDSETPIVMDTSGSDLLSFRTMHCELNALTRADGSALFTQGNTNNNNNVSLTV